MKKIHFFSYENLNKYFCAVGCDLYLDGNVLAFFNRVSSESVVVKGNSYFLNMIFKALNSDGLEEQSFISLLSVAGADGKDVFEKLKKRGFLY